MGIRVSRSSVDAEEDPPLNLAHEDDDQTNGDQNGAGPLAWLGARPTVSVTLLWRLRPLG